MNKRYKILVGIFIGLAVLLITAVFYVFQLFFTANVLVDKSDKAVLIPENTSFKELLQIMEKDTILTDKISFAFVAKLLDYQGNIKSGRYLLRKNMSNLQAVRKLRSGAQDPVKVTFNNARLKSDLAGKICKNLALDSAEFLKLLNTPNFTAKYGFDTTTIMCLFLPNTYEFYWTVSVEKLMDNIKKEYDKFWTKERLEKADKIGLTPVQVSILASIVESETKKKDEAKRIAGVYMNRLNQNDLLRADPTVIYAIGDFSKRRVLLRDLQFDSPYNTYQYSGLPPGPIYQPSVHSIDAVLNYERHKYMFFCAKEDFSGYHAFAVTFEEHKKNSKKFQDALDRLGIKN
ncbi:MAG: endolytic transglycosylase MltG [Thermoflexibacter sp.]